MGAGGFMAAGGGMQLAGGMFGRSSAKKAARAAKKIGKANAAVYEQDAAATLEKTKFDQRRQVMAGNRAMGTMLAQIGASGGRMDVGAPLAAVGQMSQEINLEQMLIGYEGLLSAQRSKAQAGIARMGGELQAREYRNQGTASLLTGFGGFAQTMSEGYRYGVF